MKVILVTGPPGVGKTTIVNRLCSRYSTKGLRIHGITTREVREHGHRIGFKITDIATSKDGWLARKDSSMGPQIGSYHVISEDLENIGVRGLERAIEGPADLIVVDEIGPMEMTSPRFRNVVSKILRGQRPTVASVKLGSHYPEVEQIRPQSIQFNVTSENRETIYRELVEQVDLWI